MSGYPQDLQDILAAAFAESGRFKEAVRSEERAIEAAQNDPLPIASCQTRNSMTAGKPYRMP